MQRRKNEPGAGGDRRDGGTPRPRPRQRLVSAALACGSLLAMLCLIPVLSTRAGFAQVDAGVPGVAHRLAALEAVVAQQQQQINQLQGVNSDLSAKVAALETLTGDMSRLTDPHTGQPTVRFSGVNVQVVDGSGDTDGAVNGRGNLIVGYNEPSFVVPNDRNGSHNLIAGHANSYASFGGLVVGRDNTISGEFASVCGGTQNTASGEFASVTGGSVNLASGDLGSVTGGNGNTASWRFASVTGGRLNTADGEFASVTGGSQNLAALPGSSVTGGQHNESWGTFATVSGGLFRSVGDDGDWRGGGLHQNQ